MDISLALNVVECSHQQTEMCAMGRKALSGGSKATGGMFEVDDALELAEQTEA